MYLSSNQIWHLNQIAILGYTGFPATIHNKEREILFPWWVAFHPFMSGLKLSLPLVVLAILGVWPCSLGINGPGSLEKVNCLVGNWQPERSLERGSPWPPDGLMGRQQQSPALCPPITTPQTAWGAAPAPSLFQIWVDVPGLGLTSSLGIPFIHVWG